MKMVKRNENKWLPGLNELRGIAALLVIPGHYFQIMELFGIKIYMLFPIPGKLGVIIFFTLSGFLITTLLINEKHTFKSINLKRFYLKRALRIWPLYYLIVFLSIFLFNSTELLQIPHWSEHLYTKLDMFNYILFLLVLPNFALTIPYAGQFWSIGVEEQYYLIQPIILKFFENTALIIGALLIAIFSKEVIFIFKLSNDSHILQQLGTMAEYFGCLGIGSIGAFLFYKNNIRFKSVIFNTITQIVSIALLFIMLLSYYKNYESPFYDSRVFSIIFLVVIANASYNDKTFLRLKNRFFDFTGRISYGIYAYHPICIGLSIACLSPLVDREKSSIAFNLLAFSATIFLTYFFSYFSFKYYESFFMKFKKVSK